MACRNFILPDFCKPCLFFLRNLLYLIKTFEKVLEIFREYLDCDLEEEVLPCREGYLRVTWNGDSRYCVDGLLSRTPDELFEVLLSDYRSYEELRLTKGCREVTEEDERQAEILCQSFRERWKEEEK